MGLQSLILLLAILPCLLQAKPQGLLPDTSLGQQFLCQSSGISVPNSDLCNGIIDCPNGEDELPAVCSGQTGVPVNNFPAAQVDYQYVPDNNQVQELPMMPVNQFPPQQEYPYPAMSNGNYPDAYTVPEATAYQPLPVDYQPLPDQAPITYMGSEPASFPAGYEGNSIDMSDYPINQGFQQSYPGSIDYPMTGYPQPSYPQYDYQQPSFDSGVAIPDGFIKLPENLQQTQVYAPGQSADYSPCSGYTQPPPQQGCPVPWIRPSLKYYYDPITRNCLPFSSNTGCGLKQQSFNGNEFPTYEACMSSCLANPNNCNGGGCPLNNNNNIQISSRPNYNYNNAFNSYPGASVDMSTNGMYPNNMNYYDPSGFYNPQNPTINNGINYFPTDNSNNNNNIQQPPSNSYFGPTDWQSDQGKIIDLDESNFDQTIKNTPRIMVKFYSPTCDLCIEFAPIYKEVAAEAQAQNLNIVFARVNMATQLGLKDKFNVNTYPKLLYWDQAFPTGVPRQYYKSYGVKNKRGILTWLRKQIQSTTVVGPPVVKPCGIGELQCSDGRCLQEKQVCDDKYDCPDGADEQGCAPDVPDRRPATNYTVCDFRCNDGACQPNENRCDGKRDCPSGIDEAHCGTCKRTQFACVSDGACINYLSRCNGVEECADGSDEDLCDVAQCSKTEFICADASCVSFSLRCDGQADCPDASDELSCPQRCDPNYQFTCNNGNCIDNKLRCDGVAHCVDSTDEIGCEDMSPPGQCSENEWQCADRRLCIDIRRRCDSYPDCPDQSDEDPTMCPRMECNDEWQFQCADKERCIDKRRQCDGYDDCLDASDEQNCENVKCDYWQFKCQIGGICIDSRRVCDGTEDCEGGTDEMECNSETTEQPPESNYPDVVTETVVPTLPSYNESTTEKECPVICPALYQPICASDGQTYSSECHLVSTSCRSGLDLTIVSYGECPSTATEEAGTGVMKCPNHQWACDDLTCIKLEQQCNGVQDCSQGEDEKYCDNYELEDTFRCYDGEEHPISRRCDNFPHCKDGEDEYNCDIVDEPDALPVVKPDPNYTTTMPPSTPAPCDPLDEFTCKDGSCRPIDARCDNMIDCDDESDEFDCPMSTTTTTEAPTTIVDDDVTTTEDSWFGGGFDETTVGGDIQFENDYDEDVGNILEYDVRGASPVEGVAEETTTTPPGLEEDEAFDNEWFE